MPLISATRSRAQANDAPGRPCCSRPAATPFHVVLIADHMSELTVSRARRALSRALSMAAAIELAELRS